MPMPEVYISQNPILNAAILGVEKPFLVLNSSLVDSFSEEEIATVIGHELGHCASGHALYKTLLYLLVQIIIPLAGPAIPSFALQGLLLAFLEWNRKSELSADRAGVLVCQHPQTSYAVLMKLAGGKQISEMNIDEFFLQAADYDKGGDLLDSVYKLFHLLSVSHPLPVLRLKELKTWIDTVDYKKILAGEYLKITQTTAENVHEEIGQAYNQYKEDLASSQDPLSKILTAFGDGVEPIRKQAEDFFNSLFKDKD
jgi:Zn-dependent protease with chaperone function